MYYMQINKNFVHQIENQPRSYYGARSTNYQDTHVLMICKFYLFFVALWPSADYSLLIHDVSRSHTTTHHSRQESSGRVISSSQRPLPDNTQHSQQTDIHAPGGIQNDNLSRRMAADLRLRPRGLRGQQILYYLTEFVWTLLF